MKDKEALHRLIGFIVAIIVSYFLGLIYGIILLPIFEIEFTLLRIEELFKKGVKK